MKLKSQTYWSVVLPRVGRLSSSVSAPCLVASTAPLARVGAGSCKTQTPPGGTPAHHAASLAGETQIV